jgi:hypothetical protein
MAARMAPRVSVPQDAATAAAVDKLIEQSQVGSIACSKPCRNSKKQPGRLPHTRYLTLGSYRYLWLLSHATCRPGLPAGPLIRAAFGCGAPLRRGPRPGGRRGGGRERPLQNRVRGAAAQVCSGPGAGAQVCGAAERLAICGCQFQLGQPQTHSNTAELLLQGGARLSQHGAQQRGRSCRGRGRGSSCSGTAARGARVTMLALPMRQLAALVV